MGKRTSEMTDREWRHAVETQRHLVEEHEETVGRHKKKLSDARAELKGSQKRLDRLLRGEDADEPVEEDPGLPFDGEESEQERQRAAAGEKSDPDDEKPKRGRGGKRQGAT